MRFWVSHDTHSCGLELDREPVDLTLGGLGEDILDELEESMHENAWDNRAPDGSRWEPLRPSTVKHKGSDTPGIVTGKMFAGLRNGIRRVDPHSLTWTHPDAGSGKLDGFHNGNSRTGQPPRRLIGWSAEAKDYARRVTKAAHGPRAILARGPSVRTSQALSLQFCPFRGVPTSLRKFRIDSVVTRYVVTCPARTDPRRVFCRAVPGRIRGRPKRIRTGS